MSKPYAIRVSSQKGGVGKTTIAVNLASILADMGYKVLIADADLSNPSIGFHFGLEEANIGMAAALTGKSPLESAVVRNDSTGVLVLPGEINNKLGPPSPKMLRMLTDNIAKMNVDFALFDTSPGFSWEGLQYFYDEALIITTPDLPALSSVLRLANIYDGLHIKHNLVVNRFKHKRYEVDVQEMERIVPKSIADHIPAVVLNPKDPFSRGIDDLGDGYSFRSTGRPRGNLRAKGGLLAMLRSRLFGI